MMQHIITYYFKPKQDISRSHVYIGDTGNWIITHLYR